MSSSNPFRLVLALALTIPAACAPQVGDDYKGEPLASLRGVVLNQLDRSVGPLEAVLVWANGSGEPDTITGDRVAVEGDFPASFRLDMYQPPEEAALNDFTIGGEYPEESRIGVAYITALPEGYELTGAETEPYGMSEGHLLIYVERDVQAGTSGEALVGGTLEAGFHLLEVIDVDDPACSEEANDCLRPAPGGLDTEVELRIDEAELIDFPNWQ